MWRSRIFDVGEKGEEGGWQGAEISAGEEAIDKEKHSQVAWRGVGKHVARLANHR